MRVVLRVLCALSFLSPVARADDAILILDASNSMWGHVDGKSKVEIAKRVVTDLLAELPADRRLGFVAYGHRRASDCDDIEELVAVGADRTAIAAQLRELNFKGKTPLTAAVRFAADKLAYTKQKATVILVSDGIESCHADPCAAAAQLEKQGIDLTVHVVGFGLRKGEAKSLRCVADATGGKYLAANNAADLAKALQQTVVEQPKQEALGEATLQAPASVEAGSNFEVKWTGPNQKFDSIALAFSDAPPNDRLAHADTYRGTGTLEMTATTRPGKFELRYVRDDQKVLARIPIEVTAAIATVHGPASVVAGSNFEVTWTGPNNARDYVTLAFADARASDDLTHVSAYHGTGTQQLQAPASTGRLELRYVLQNESVLARSPIEIVDATATVQSSGTVAAASMLDVTWTGPNNQGDYITLAHADSSPSEDVSHITPWHGTGKGQLRAPLDPGTYQLRYVLKNARTLATASVQVTAQTATLDGPSSAAANGSLEVSWTGPNFSGDYVTIAVPDAPGSQDLAHLSPYRGTGSGKLKAPAQPGNYELRYVLQNSKVIARRALAITP